MKITAITRFKHAELLRIMRIYGFTAVSLAETAKMSPYKVRAILNLTSRPTEDEANRIQVAFGDLGEYVDVTDLWPDSFKGFSKAPVIEQTADVDVLSLSDCAEAMQIADENKPDLDELSGALEYAMGGLSPESKNTVKMRHFDGLTCEQIGKLTKRHSQRVSQLEHSGLKKIRNSAIRMERLRDFVSQ